MAHPLDTLRPGYWHRVPNSKMMTWVKPNPLPPGLSGYPGICAESSGIFDTKRERWVGWGGGHADYAGNELPAFTVEALTWSLLWGPTPNEQINPLDEPSATREMYKDGNPASRHTRDGLEYLPTQDAFFSHGGSLWSGNGGNSRSTWLFRFLDSKFVRKSSSPDVRYTNVETAYDSRSDGVLVHREETLYRWNPANDTWFKLGTDPKPPWRKTGAFDSKRNYFFLFTSNGVILYDLNKPKPISAGFCTTQGTIAGPGAEYVAKYDKIYVWEHGPSVRVFDPETFAWSVESPPPDSPALPPVPSGGARGCAGRWRYMPARDAFVAINSATDDVYFYKPVALVSPPNSPRNLIGTLKGANA